ncbi:hypothetical protein N781_04980 [Pontibacillus halophilus JSM 076056 = DSM 19796]|uniref:Uncharacterized protein n=1 Tax=Pontibacillus halophilus JSM 076056 = DSM 19796 TaxID=1385510 RepID=A0A0A5GIV6_9BACI|nr:hypothetical protein [Pontibacillus halophilus]KGX91158.1 hypothetical protein N781_04980 [Pontibacillus halophilus JSM 076056 = DSM 19796]
MKQIRVGSWTIEVDVHQTKEFYNAYHLITEDCPCDYCANYVVACETLSREIKELFQLLGIDPHKEGEVSEYMENEDGTHLYDAFYHLVGRIVEEPNDSAPHKTEDEFSSLHEHEIHIAFSNDLALVPEGFPKPIIQLEIQLNLPWLVNQQDKEENSP